jgi:hypothetical protein
MKFILTLISLLIFTTNTIAQDSNWKKLVKSAEEFYAKGKYEEAAQNYFEAWKLKSTKTDLAYNAGECYLKLRDYNKAALAFENVKDDLENFPDAGLKYAQCLKQNKQYDLAKTQLETYSKQYTREDKAGVIKVVLNEIKGCELADKLPVDQTIEVEHLSESVNTMANEFAPLPFSDDIFYFSSTMTIQSQLYRSQLKAGNWTKAIQPNFPKIDNDHVCGGTFTPDHKRFYFTICETEQFDHPKATCDIYVTVRNDGSWITPKKLRDYVKLEGTTAMHPYVINKGETEILFFASDRKGSVGGIDIWYMTRNAKSSEYDFTLPKNAGPQVNTTGDEISPYFDKSKKTLYFSSNGHPTIGGFDIFRSKETTSDWSNPENLGFPYNSSADDYYFIKNESNTGGFFSSNRLFGLKKISTKDDDIFYFTEPQQEVIVKGNIYNKNTNLIIEDAQIILYEKIDNGQKRILHSQISSNGSYEFSLIPDREFRIEAIKEGFKSGSFNFNTFAFSADKKYGKPIYLESTSKAIANQPRKLVLKEENSTASVNNVIPGKKPTQNNNNHSSNTSTNNEAYVNSYFQGNEVLTDAPKHNGIYYKVQISTVETYNSQDPQFNTVKSMGRFDIEKIPAKRWTRILLADYFSLAEARKITEKARSLGFPESFIVRYKNGKRL